MVPGRSNSGIGLLTTHSSTFASPSQVSGESSDASLANVEQRTTKKEREATARWISVVVLVVVESGIVVALAFPLLPFFLRDTDNTGLGNSSIDRFTLGEYYYEAVYNGSSTLIGNKTCSDMFYLDQELQLCLPQCGVWTPLPQSTEAVEVITLIAAAIGSLAAVAVLFLACRNRKKFFTYPAVLLIYQTLFITVQVVANTAPLLMPPKVLCSSPNLLESLEQGKASTFCQLTGGLFVCTIMSVVLLWLFQSASFLWGVVWPYHYSVTKSSGRMKYYHISVVVISVFGPLVLTLIIQFNGGYGLILALSPRCGGLNPDIVFYSVLLPMDIIVIVGILLLVITLWNIADVANRCSGVRKKKYRRKAPKVKLTILILHFSLLTLYNLSVTTRAISNTHKADILNYFQCEAVGKEAECLMESLQELQSNNLMHAFGRISVILMPCVFFIFFLDFSKLCHRQTHSTSTQIVHRPLV